MKNYNIAVIPGDGIGNEVMSEGLKVLTKVSEVFGETSFKFTQFDWGCEYYLKYGKMMEDDGLKKLEQFDAILLGAVGFPGVPDHISLRELLLKIRQGFNQYINLRPVKLLPNVWCPLEGKTSADIDMLFIRENTEGEYAGLGGIQKEDTEDEIAIQSGLFTRKTTEKAMAYAFEMAKQRRTHGYQGKVTSITKSNALNYSMVMWDKIFKEQALRFPEIKTESFHVDAASMYMVQKPEIFDVIVASNLFGDILTDLGAALQGGLGFAAGANLNPERKYPSMFEPVHGSAPEISGKNIANPIAMVWTVKMMLDFLGHSNMSEHIMRAIIDALANRDRLTPDLGGKGTTKTVGEDICKLLSR